MVEILKAIAMKAPPCVVQKLKVGGHRHNVLVLFPLPSNLEVAEEFGGHIGFERLLDACPEARAMSLPEIAAYLQEVDGL